MNIDLNELEALARAATPGEWQHKKFGVIHGGPMIRFANGSAQGQIAMFCGTFNEQHPAEPERQIANADFASAANPAAVLELIAIARQAPPAIPAQPRIDTFAIRLVSGEELLACAAQSVQPPAPVDEPNYEAGRKQGRAEALAILMQLDPEGGIDEYTGWSTPVGPEDEGAAYWEEEKLRELFAADGALADMMDKAEAQYWEYIGMRDEAERAKNFAANMHISGKVREVLSKAGEFDLMGRLCSSGRDSALLEYLIRYKHCMSYNDSYFSEPAGELKRMVYATDRTHPANVAQAGSTGAQAACWCETCRPVRMWDNRMVLCPTCGNKRCPRGNDHRHDCTGSNEPGQPGSSYPAAVANQETPP